MNAGESPRNQGRSVCRPPLSAHRRRSRGLRKNAAVERRKVNAHRTGRAPQGVSNVTRAFRRSAPLTFVRELSPLVSEGMEMPGAPRALREQGRRSFGCFADAGCLKCESDVRVPKRVECFGETNPSSFARARHLLFHLPWRGGSRAKRRGGVIVREEAHLPPCSRARRRTLPSRGGDSRVTAATSAARKSGCRTCPPASSPDRSDIPR